MTILTLALIMLVAQFGLMGAALYLRYLGNKALFKTDAPLKPVRSNNPFFGGFSGLFDLLDRIPILRRSGTANEFDLLKAMLLTTVPIFLFELLLQRPSLLVAVLSANFLMFLINVTLLAHPVLKRLSGGNRK
jgi:hypothetical protein